MRNYSQVFAVGDIHGCKELLNGIHNKIIEASKNKEGEKFPCRINLDTRSFYSGKLSCLLIEDRNLNFIDTLNN